MASPAAPAAPGPPPTTNPIRVVDPKNYHPQGYHRLADLMGPYQEVAVFRRFGSLNMLNLLSLQAELLSLEEEFRVICQSDDELPPVGAAQRTFSRSFSALRSMPASKQYEKLLAIRAKLKEYNEALLAVSQTAKIPTPGRSQLEFLRGWSVGDKEGNGFLGMFEGHPWIALYGSNEAAQKRLERDLTTMQPSPTEQDLFAEFLSSDLLSWFHRFVGSKSKRRQRAYITDDDSGNMYYDDASVSRVNTILVSVISSSLPILAIVALYFIRSVIQRIGIAAAFTVLFAFALAVFTNARRLEIFASTAAFAAVQVVFIGSVPSSGDVVSA